MKLVLKGHDERYVVEQGMLNLFPGERPVYEPIGPEDDTWARVSLREEADGCTVEVELSWRGTAATHRLDAPLTGDEFQREGLRRRAIGRCFFLAAHGVTGTAPPWGMLTGVRPVKLPTREMAAGATPEQARASLERDCYVSPERAELAVDCAQASLNAQRTLKEDEVSLYVGIPFCPTRCAYCSFVSADVGRALKLIDPFLDALCRELAATGAMLADAGLRVRTVYFGGGTPTTLSAPQLDRLMGELADHIDLSGCTEYTVEAGRPDTITAEKLAVLARRGCSRVSVNPQTMQDAVLERMGRAHRADDILRAYALARESGIGCINMDLIAGLPGDSAEGFRASLEQVLELIQESKLFQSFSGALHSAISQGLLEVTTSAAQAVAGYLAREVARMALFLICFALVLVGWTMLSRVLDLAFRLPVLSTLNHWSGAAVGLGKGCVLLFIACWLFRGLFPTEAVEQSILLRFFCGAGPLALPGAFF